jgi:hypothetical protein
MTNDPTIVLELNIADFEARVDQLQKAAGAAIAANPDAIIRIIETETREITRGKDTVTCAVSVFVDGALIGECEQRI